MVTKAALLNKKRLTVNEIQDMLDDEDNDIDIDGDEVRVVMLPPTYIRFSSSTMMPYILFHSCTEKSYI